MKKKALELTLDKAISEFVNVIKDTKSFVVSQTPQVLREILLYYKVNSIMWFIVGLVGMIGSLVLYHNGNCVPLISYSNYDFLPTLAGKAIMLYIFALVSALAGVIISFSQIGDLMKLFLAPKTFLLEYFRNFNNRD